MGAKLTLTLTLTLTRPTWEQSPSEAAVRIAVRAVVRSPGCVLSYNIESHGESLRAVQEPWDVAYRIDRIVKYISSRQDNQSPWDVQLHSTQ